MPRSPAGPKKPPTAAVPASAATARSLADLGPLRQALAEAQARAAAERLRAEAERQQRERERRLFSLSVGPVQALKAPERLLHARPEPAPEPRQKELDEQRALLEAMSDEVDVESLLLTDDGLGFRREGISLDVLARLRRGQWSIQDHLDLHGLRRDEAREALGAFIRSASQRGLRCLRVVHGKGLGSPGREPVLKSKVQKWLAQRQEVIAFAQASGPLGGAGAVIVLLAS